ncbi:MAG: helix-turn-helix transcriptional regulator [Alphaproteobacteria bacterium]|nr:helix-turn-helix transcriptional regulator [Alphaproteobacteria bacterium]
MNPTGSPFAIAEIGALLGDPARANMMLALIAGRALTAGELAWCARVTAQTASGHLAKLTAAGLLAVQSQGRHRYYRLASPLVAQMLEGMQVVAAVQGPPRYRPKSRIDDALRAGRTCYDHLAGRLGVALADALIARGCVVLSNDGGEATESGMAFFRRLAIDTAPRKGRRRCFCRPCLDWSERRPHIAGQLGAALAERCFDLGWIQRVRDSRAVVVTTKGQSGFKREFGITGEALMPEADPPPVPLKTAV